MTRGKVWLVLRGAKWPRIREVIYIFDQACNKWLIIRGWRRAHPSSHALLTSSLHPYKETLIRDEYRTNQQYSRHNVATKSPIRAT